MRRAPRGADQSRCAQAADAFGRHTNAAAPPHRWANCFPNYSIAIVRSLETVTGPDEIYQVTIAASKCVALIHYFTPLPPSPYLFEPSGDRCCSSIYGFYPPSGRCRHFFVSFPSSLLHCVSLSPFGGHDGCVCKYSLHSNTHTRAHTDARVLFHVCVICSLNAFSLHLRFGSLAAERRKSMLLIPNERRRCTCDE